jgi:tRNA dimethylallyltransferase
MENDSERPKLLVIAGPTASGKSDLALEIAKQFNGELICADSLTVRKYADIGSAKPSAEERKTIPHHLLDVAEPCEDFTAASFKRLAEDAILDIQNRAKLSIMVGGTGLYIDAVLFDFGFLPPGDRTKREKFNVLSNDDLLKLINERGISIEGIDIRNKRRLIRLLETDGARPKKGQMRPGVLMVGINPPKEELKMRIINRVSKMIDDGLEKEVKALARQYGWGCEALKAIGYKEWQPYFENEIGIEELKSKIISSTNGLAKRQYTWLKRNPQINWFESSYDAQKFIQKSLLNT